MNAYVVTTRDIYTGRTGETLVTGPMVLSEDDAVARVAGLIVRNGLHGWVVEGVRSS